MDTTVTVDAPPNRERPFSTTPAMVEPPKRRIREARARWLLAISAAAFAVGLVVAIRDLRHVLYDDAAITMRFAYRIAHGEGFTYNPGDRTNGASSPLYTLVLALLSFWGAGLVVSAKAIGILCYAGTAASVAWLAGRVAGLLAAVSAPIILLLSLNFRTNMLSGMESALACLLGIGAIIALSEKRYTISGLLLGLCLFNKLDAGALALAIAAAMLLAQRRLPLRLVWVSAAVLAPWLIFSQFYFGSVIPNSATTKLGELSEGTQLDHTWIWDTIVTGDRFGWVVAFALTSVLVLVGRRDRDRLTVALVLVLWSALHISAFSLVDLGGAYGWYTTAAYPGLVTAAAIALGLLVTSMQRRDHDRFVAPVTMVLLVAIVFAPLKENLRVTANAIAHGHTEDPYESFERTRMETGWYLSAHAKPGDVVETCFGWPAFYAKQTVIKETCPLSTSEPVGEPTWIAGASFPQEGDMTPPEGWSLVFSKASPSGGRSWVHRNG